MNETDSFLLAFKTAGAFALARTVSRKQLRILCYHGIWLGGDPHYGDCLYMSERKFEERMEWLAASGYPVLPLDEALERLNDGSLPANAVAITVDDGWYSTYKCMLPVFKRLRLPVTLYVTTYYSIRGLPVLNVLIGYLIDRASENTLDYALISQGTPISQHPPASPQGRSFLASHLSSAADSLPFDQRWTAVESLASSLGMSNRLKELVENRVFHLMTEEQIRETSASGVDIQLHTHTHRMHGFDPARVGSDIERNRLEITRITGRLPSALRHFCYPSGVHAHAAFDTLRMHGVVSATTTEFGLVKQSDERMSLSRILDCESLSELGFEARLSGLWGLLRSTKIRLAA